MSNSHSRANFYKSWALTILTLQKTIFLERKIFGERAFIFLNKKTSDRWETMKLSRVAGFLKSRLVPVGSTLLHQSWHLTQGVVEAGTNYATKSLIPVTSRSLATIIFFRSFVVKIVHDWLTWRANRCNQTVSLLAQKQAWKKQSGKIAVVTRLVHF